MYIIKIDQSTIKKNDDAGKDQFLVPGIGTETKVVFMCLDTLCKRYPEMIGVTGSGHIVKKITLIGNFVSDVKDLNTEELRSSEWKKVYKRDVEEYLLIHTIERHVEIVRLLQPIPNYSAVYESQVIECKYCGEQFDHTALLSEDFDDYDDFPACKDNICPKCNIPDCCEIEYEKFDSVVGKVKTST